MFNLLLDIAWLENAVQETWLSPSDFLLTNKGGGGVDQDNQIPWGRVCN